jgi:hypothetical protein
MRLQMLLREIGRRQHVVIHEQQQIASRYACGGVACGGLASI